MPRRITKRVRAEIVELYSSGMSSRRVAEELEVSKTTVLSVLKAAGVELRPWGVRY